MHLAGFVDRIATDWAGPYSRVVRRKVTLLGSIYAGDSMVGRGRVIDKRLRDAPVTRPDTWSTSRSRLQPARRTVLSRRGHAPGGRRSQNGGGLLRSAHGSFSFCSEI